MTDPAQFWQQACELLGQNQYEQSHALLHSALEQLEEGHDAQHQAQLLLYLASILSLYGEDSSRDLTQVLQDALSLWPALSLEPLYQALEAEALARLQGPQAPPPTEEARFALGSDGPLARYHTVVALNLMERYQEIMAMSPAVDELPPHLRWRLRQWQASSEEAQGNLSDAAHLYAEAAHLASGLDRATLLQEQAALLLHQGEFGGAQKALSQAWSGYSPHSSSGEELSKAGWFYLQAQLDLALEQHAQALKNVEEAIKSIARAKQEGAATQDLSYGVALLHGQILSALGQTENALREFEAALQSASAEEQPYAHHELGVALLDLDRPLEAREHLERALTHYDYPFTAEIMADLAESHYRLGQLKEAQEEAQKALEQGATVPASLVLGSVALEYYHLEEALEHYERVTQEADMGSRDWVAGHQMAADIMSQQGFMNPAAAYAHAQQALEYTDPSDEWYDTLQEHLQKAGALMGQGSGRTLN